MRILLTQQDTLQQDIPQAIQPQVMVTPTAYRLMETQTVAPTQAC